MASCSKCGTNVGCPCNLKNGVCSYCAKKINDISVNYEELISTSNVDK